MDNPRISLVDATKILHIRLDTLMAWIQSGKCPFGDYVKKEGRHRGHYIIIRERMDAYLKAADIKVPAA